MSDPSPSARAAALRRLAGDESPAALSLLRERLADPHPYVRRATAGVLGLVTGEPSRKALLRAMAREKNPVSRAEICRTYLLWADETGQAALRKGLEDRAPPVRWAALRGYVALLAAEPPPEGTSTSSVAAERWTPVVARVSDPDGGVAAEALAALAEVRPLLPRAQHARLVQEAFSRSDPRVRLAALESSVVVSREAAVFAALRGLADAVWSVRLAAAELAGALPEQKVLAGLLPVLEDERSVVREAAHEALIRLTGIPFEADAARWRTWLETDGRTFDFEARARQREQAGTRRPFASGRNTVAGPSFYGVPVNSRHVAFVLDASGSMREPAEGGASRWAVVCNELQKVLEALRERGRVTLNIHLFADEVEALFPQAVALTAPRRKQIEKALEAHAPRGRTALYDGIAAALEDPEVDTVIVLSDGAPSAGAFFTKTDLLQELALRNRWRRARIHVVAIGRDGIAKRWRTLLEQLAAQNAGSYVERR